MTAEKCTKPPDVYHGLYASGESVVADPDLVFHLRGRTHQEYGEDVAAIEMEAAGIAAACALTQTKFLIAKAISDFGEGKTDEWQPCSASVSLAAVIEWARSLTREDIWTLIRRDSSHLKGDPYLYASRVAFLAGAMLPPRGVSLKPKDVRAEDDVSSDYDRRTEEFIRDSLLGHGANKFIGEESKDISRHMWN